MRGLWLFPGRALIQTLFDQDGRNVIDMQHVADASTLIARERSD
jgi:hypothetical protein